MNFFFFWIKKKKLLIKRYWIFSKKKIKHVSNNLFYIIIFLKRKILCHWFRVFFSLHHFPRRCCCHRYCIHPFKRVCQKNIQKLPFPERPNWLFFHFSFFIFIFILFFGCFNRLNLFVLLSIKKGLDLLFQVLLLDVTSGGIDTTTSLCFLVKTVSRECR